MGLFGNHDDQGDGSSGGGGSGGIHINTVCNSTLDNMRLTPGVEKAVVGSYTFHDVIRVVSGAFGSLALLLSVFLILMHAANYTQPRQQKHVIRILFMIPVFAALSWFQIQWYWLAIYFQALITLYEAVALVSLFALMRYYIAPTLNSQEYFFYNMSHIQDWIGPVKRFGSPSNGLSWFRIIWIGVFQGFIVRAITTIATVLSEHFGTYCNSSNSIAFAHIWIKIINLVDMLIIMVFLLQFHRQLKQDLAQHKVLFKFLAVKVLIFLSVVQTLIFSVALNKISPGKVVAYPDLKFGIPALLQCFEAACCAVLHIFTFSWKPYSLSRDPVYYPVPEGTATPPTVDERQKVKFGFLRAIFDALNMWDLFKDVGRAVGYLFGGLGGDKTDEGFERIHHDDNVRLRNISSETESESYNMAAHDHRKQYHNYSRSGMSN